MDSERLTLGGLTAWAWLALAACIVVAVKLYRVWIAIRAIERLPGPPFKFPLGTLHRHPTPELHVKMLKELTAEYPESGFRLWLGPTQAICVLNTPETVKLLLEQNPPKSPMLYRYIQPWLGQQSLLLLEGEAWKEMRRLLTPAFHLHILKFYAPVTVEATKVLVEKLAKTHSEDPSKDVDMFNEFALLTLDVIGRAAFSYDGDPQRNPEDRYSQSIAQIAEFVVKRAVNPALLSDAIYFRTKDGKNLQKTIDYVHSHADKIIKQRAKELEGLTMEDIGRERPGGRKLLDFLDILLMARDDKGKPLSHEAIRHQCDTFLFAGHDTTSTCLSWLCYLLSTHPEIQSRCRQEVIDTFGIDREPTYEEVQNGIPYLTACIKEALRIFPPVPGAARVLTEPLKLPNTTLQPGTTVAVAIFCLHHNPRLWEDPTAFRPERFLGKTTHDSHSFLPFSVGRRNCIGQNFAINEIRIIMCQLLRSLRILPSSDPDYVPRPETKIVLRSVNGVRMRFEVGPSRVRTACQG